MDWSSMLVLATETSIRDLIRHVQDVTAATPEVIYNATTSGGVSRMCADLTLASQKLNYRPRLAWMKVEINLNRDIDSSSHRLNVHPV
jgi:UDP-glucose 4-epimerase